MATENLDIKISQKGAEKTSSAIQSVGASALTAGKAIKLLTTGLSGLAVVGIAKQIIGMANSYQQLSNKVKVAVGEQGDLNGTLSELFNIADRTRGPIDSLVTLYQRGSLAANELGASQKELLQFTETVGTALALQGGAASEASGALLQLSQSLGSGVVRAEEFNSILEGAFPIALAAAKGIDAAGGSVAKLRTLVTEGKISSDVFFKGILSQSADLDRQFKQVAPTVDQALTRIKNAFIEAAGSGNLDPLVDSLNKFADLVRDPSFQKGFGSLVSGIVQIASVGVTAASELGSLQQVLGQAVASITGNISLEDELQAQLDGVNEALKAEGFFESLAIPIEFLFKDKQELEALQADLQKQLDALEFSITGRSAADRRAAEEAAANAPKPNAAPKAAEIDPALLKRQDQFILGLQQQAEELRIQATLGDAAAASLARYKTEQEIIALQLGPAQAQQARDLTEAIIAQNKAIEDQTKLADQRTFIQQLEEQEQALVIQAEAGTKSAQALLLWRTEMEAAKLGGPEFVQLSLDIAAGINAQTDALERQARQKDDLDLIKGLQAESELIGLSNRERAIEIELRKLSAEATAEQRAQVEQLAGSLFDDNEALKRQAITFEEFLKETARSAQQTLSGALADPLGDGLEELPARFSKVLTQMAADFLASQIFQQLSNIGSGSDSGGFLKAIGGFFAGGFATGGEFQVPGSGGVDSQLVAMKATPGETVSVSRPSDKQSSAPPIVNVAAPQVIVVDNSEKAQAYLNGPGGENAVLTHIRNNPDTVRGVT
jgi:tape measure domain-containing protein